MGRTVPRNLPPVPHRRYLMKIKTLAIAASVSAPFILSGSASGEFVNVYGVLKPNNFGLLVVNVYALFDRPGEDHMLSVSGTPQSPLIIKVHQGSFYNHPFGNDRAPTPALVAAFPSLAFDTFVTIGKKLSPGDQLTITPGFPTGITGSQLLSTSWGWEVTPNNPQGNPFDAVNSFPGDGQILIGQFSTAMGLSITGTMSLQYISNGVAGQSVLCFGFGCLNCQCDAACTDFDPCNGEEVCENFNCLFSPPVPDCNANGVLDSCDIADGTSQDADGNGIPDTCDACPWDLDGDLMVGITDFLGLLGAWGTNPGGPPDFDGDGDVGVVDFLELLANWGPCP